MEKVATLHCNLTPEGPWKSTTFSCSRAMRIPHTLKIMASRVSTDGAGPPLWRPIRWEEGNLKCRQPGGKKKGKEFTYKNL